MSQFFLNSKEQAEGEKGPLAAKIGADRRATKCSEEGARLKHGDDVGRDVVGFLSITRIAKVLLEVGLCDNTSTDTAVGSMCDQKMLIGTMVGE